MATVNKKELINDVLETVNLTHDQANKVINAVFDSIREEVSQGNKVQLIGFGSFEPRKRAARKGRNPQTGKTIKIPKSVIPLFRAGQVFKNEVKANQKDILKMQKKAKKNK